MKRKSFFWLLAMAVPCLVWAVTVYWTSAPSSANSGQGYYIEAQSYGYGSYIDQYLYKNGSYVGYGSGPDWAVAATSQTDYGSQVIEYRTEASDGWSYDQAYHYLTVIPTNQAPFGAFDWAADSVSLGQALSGNGWAADDEMGAPVSRVDIIIDGNDVGDATLGDNRPDVSSAYGRPDFQYSGWHISFGTGGLSSGYHVVEMVAWDNNGASASLGSRGFTVTNAAPTNVLTSPGSGQINLNDSLLISAHATDADGNITTHNLDIQRPDGSWNWQGGFASGEPYLGGPVGSGADSTRSAWFTFNQPGYWHVRSWVGDANGNNLHSATVQIYVVNPNHPPVISAWPTLPPTFPNSGVNFTAQATGYDQDGNLSGVIVDLSTNGGAWTPFAYNGGGNGTTNTTDGNLLTGGAEGTTYQFRALASDSAGANSGAYSYTSVYSVNRTPSVSMQILDANLNAYPIGGNGRAQVPVNSTYYVRVEGADPDGRMAVLYERLITVAGVEMFNQVSVSGASAAHNFGPFNSGPTAGFIETWAHAQDADSVPYAWQGGGWAGTQTPDIDVHKLPPAVPTITSPSTMVYGNAYTATASGGSGTGALEWALGSGSTAPGAAIHPTTGVVTALGTGTVSIKVRRLGDATYYDSAWTTPDFPVTVTPRPLTVTLTGSKVYDSTTASTGASASITGGNLVLGDTIAFSYGATSSPVAGAYTGIVTSTISNTTAPGTRTGSYAITYAGSYGITPRAITVTLGGGKVYDSTTIPTGATASITVGSLAGSDTIAYAFTNLPSPIAGTYADITTATISNPGAPTARSGSYTITYTGGYVVSPRPITVTLGGSKVYDSTTAPTGATAEITSGTLAGSDTIAYNFAATASPLAGAYTGLTTATISNPVAPTARSSSYTITYAGSYAITPRPITVTLAGSKIYDASTTPAGATASITVGSLAGSDTIAYSFANTGSPVAGSYSGLTTATVSNATAPTARSGSYAITYNGSYVITPRPITVTLGGSKIYDSTTAPTGATAVITSGDLAPGDSIAHAFAATSSPVAGSYNNLATSTISNATAPTARTASYAITYAGNYVINPRAITVTLGGGKVYDSTTTPTGATASITGGSLAGTDSISYSFAATGSPVVGVYTGLTTATITNAVAPTGRSGSYTITYTGSYAITPRAITVTLGGTKVYDSTTSPTGATASITAGSLAGSDTISYAFANTAAPVAGTYTDLTTATVSNAAAPTARSSSYIITYAGSYAITPRAITVTLAGSKIYDASLTPAGATASITVGSLAGSDTIAYSFADTSSPVVGGYAGLTTATISNAAAPTARSNSYTITYTGSYAIQVRPITITLAGTRVYDSTTGTAGATATITSGNLAPGDVLNLAYGAVSSPVVGTYTGLITPTITNPNPPTSRTSCYAITFGGGYTITPRAITVTLGGTKIYDSTTTAIGATASITSGSLAGSDSIGYSFSAASSPVAGAYTGLTVATITNGVAPTARTNCYTITHNGSYAITPRAITVTLTGSRVYDGSISTSGASASITVGSLAGTDTIGYAFSSTLPSPAAGSYPGLTTATISNATAPTPRSASYTITYNGSYTVTARAVTVTISGSKVYDSTTTPTGLNVSIGSLPGGDIGQPTISPLSSPVAGSYMPTITIAVTNPSAPTNRTASYTFIYSGTYTVTQRPITVTLGGSKVQDGTTTPTGANATITSGALAGTDTVAYGFSNTVSSAAGIYTGLTTATFSNTVAPTPRSTSYAITYAGSYAIRPQATVSSGLRAWYRADFGITKDGSGNVSQWADASGQGFTLTQTDPAKQPLWGATALNSRPALDFADGERLKSAVIDLLDAAGSNQDLTVLVVFQPSATQLSGASVLDHDSAQQGFSFKQDGATTNKYLLRWRNQAQTAWQGEGGPSVSTVVQPHLLTFIKAGTTQSAYVNGETAGSATVQANMHKPSAAFAVGGSAANAADYFGGRIAEVLIYNRALTPEERTLIESGLGTHYGLSNVGGEPDALPDPWELQYFGHLGYGPTENPDGDTLNNLQEALLGRNPLKGAQADTGNTVNLRVFSPRP